MFTYLTHKPHSGDTNLFIATSESNPRAHLKLDIQTVSCKGTVYYVPVACCGINCIGVSVLFNSDQSYASAGRFKGKNPLSVSRIAEIPSCFPWIAIAWPVLHSLHFRGTELLPVYLMSPPEWFCIKMGSDESHFDVSLTVRGKVTIQCQWPTTLK